MEKQFSLVQFHHAEVRLPGREEPLLRDMNLSVLAGEWVAIVGISGCGKSVLARVIARIEPIGPGMLQLSEHAAPVQLVMQNPEAQLVGSTALEDLCFGLENYGVQASEMRFRAADALQQVGLSGYEEAPVNKLSGGQKQLLALAGALVLEPGLLLTDEVTSMLDPDSRHRVLNVLQNYHREGGAIVMVTQMLEELVHADRVIALHEGRVAYDGEPGGFFYNGDFGEPGICDSVGLEPPITVQTAKILQRKGVRDIGRPITPEQLMRTVSAG